ncbi:MAG: lipocalin family protein [Flavobacteriaceae bacterium]|nr:lipocalin family protein [Flavobacteriaceae bacterium]
MKDRLVKVLFLSLMVLFVSCSSDDDSGPSLSQESRDLVGEWYLDILEVEGGSNVLLVPCSQQIEYDFQNNLEYTRKDFAGDDPENCAEAATSRGNWEDIQNNILILNPLGSNPTQSFTIEFEGSNIFRLSSAGNSTVRVFRRKN